MGEMADFALEYQGYPEDSHWPIDARPQFNENNKVCVYCGEGNLHWSRTSRNTWRLYSGTRPHSCPDFVVTKMGEPK